LHNDGSKRALVPAPARLISAVRAGAPAVVAAVGDEVVGTVSRS
jgi:hypothetical protein